MLECQTAGRMFIRLDQRHLEVEGASDVDDWQTGPADGLLQCAAFDPGDDPVAVPSLEPRWRRILWGSRLQIYRPIGVRMQVAGYPPQQASAVGARRFDQ